MSKKQTIQELLNRKPGNTGIQETIYKDGVDEGTKFLPSEKKKATFELDGELHKKLKVFAASHNKKMVDVVEAAIEQYLSNS